MPKVDLSQRPKKPRRDFPLFPHASGRWAKKVNGNFKYFGTWSDDPRGERAEALWQAQREDLLAGRVPRVASLNALTLAEVCNHFLTWKDSLVSTGELTRRTWENYREACLAAIEAIGRDRPVDSLRPEDFQDLRAQMAKRWGPVRLGNMIGAIKTAFTYANEAQLIEHPMRFGPGFKKPSAGVLRRQRQAKGPKLFEAAQIHALLEAASPLWRALLLLGINGAMGNSDMGHLPTRALDLDAAWLNYPRHKTGIDRRIPLWPETVEALRHYLARRPRPAEPAGADLLFITSSGKDLLGNARGCRVSDPFRRLARRAGVEGRAFYDLRRTFQTVAEGSRDLSAVQAIMGHAAQAADMSARYRQSIGDERLRAVADHVHAWLFGAH